MLFCIVLPFLHAKYVSLGGRMIELIYVSTQAIIFDILMKIKDWLK
jgi:hypothetical protein